MIKFKRLDISSIIDHGPLTVNHRLNHLLFTALIIHHPTYLWKISGSSEEATVFLLEGCVTGDSWIGGCIDGSDWLLRGPEGGDGCVDACVHDCTNGVVVLGGGRGFIAGEGKGKKEESSVVRSIALVGAKSAAGVATGVVTSRLTWLVMLGG